MGYINGVIRRLREERGGVVRVKGGGVERTNGGGGGGVNRVHTEGGAYKNVIASLTTVDLRIRLGYILCVV